jgi:alkylated DNA repair dioxygenase AlkB
MQRKVVPNGFERLPMRDADVLYADHLELGDDPDAILRELVETVDWRSQKIVMWGRSVQQPRLVAWVGDAGCRYSYSGLDLEPATWSPLLKSLRERVSRAAGVELNSVLLNYYRDHRDGMGYHSDDEPELGRHPVIASLSLGEPRRFLMKHRYDRALATVRLDLASGSLLLMQGATQHYWKHALPKRSQPCGPRINLTFRRILR